VIVLLYAFLALIGVNWPELPFNARLADLIFVPLLLAILVQRPSKLSWHRSDTAVALYLIAALPAIAVSGDRRESAIELVREIYLVAIYVVCAIAARRGWSALIGQGLTLGALALSTLGLIFIVLQFAGAAPWPAMGEVMSLPYLGSTLRLRSLTTSEAMLACLLTAAIPFAIVTTTRRRLLNWWRAAVMTTAALLTFSHALAGFSVAVVVSLWPSLTAWPRRVAVTIAVAAVLALNFAATISIKSIAFGNERYTDASQYHYAIEERQARIAGATITYNVMSYLRIKQVAWRAFVEHPIAGIGLNQFHTETRRAFEDGRLTSAYQEIDPHSTVPGRFAETGIIGGAALLWLWWIWAQMAAASARTGAIGLAAAAAVAGLIVSSANADIMNFRFLWVIAGLMRGLQASTPSPQER
jgi:hypothetical protein